MKNGKTRRVVVVAGGAGFLGSHLCDALLAEGGARVVCVDNYRTGRRENLRHLSREPRFDLLEADVVGPLPPRLRADAVFNLACAASPPLYQADPEHTMLTNVLGTRNLLRLAEASGAKLGQRPGNVVQLDRKSTRLNSSHSGESRMPSSA